MADVQTKQADAIIDFAQLVLRQIDRCNIALTQEREEFITAVKGLSCMLAGYKLNDERYRKEIELLYSVHKKSIEKIQEGLNCSNAEYRKQCVLVKEANEMQTAMEEYECLIRLCSRANLFPAKRGEFNDDDD